MSATAHTIRPALPDRADGTLGIDAKGRLGRDGEQLAVEHLERDDGVEVVARNWRLATGQVRGELDVVAIDPDDGLLIVCEVKTRRSDRFGGPIAAVTLRKQAKIRQLTTAFVIAAELPRLPLRFDVVGVWIAHDTEPVLTHLPGAF